MPDHMIIIRPDSSGTSFKITVAPSPAWARFDGERPDHRSAMRYATSLRVVHGWRIRDETGEMA